MEENQKSFKSFLDQFKEERERVEAREKAESKTENLVTKNEGKFKVKLPKNIERALEVKRNQESKEQAEELDFTCEDQEQEQNIKEKVHKEQPQKQMPDFQEEVVKKQLENPGIDALAQARYLIKTGLVPETLDTEGKVVIAIKMCNTLGFFGSDILFAIRNICIIHGTPTLWGDLPLLLARRTGFIEDMQEFFVNENQEKICYENKNLKDKIFACVVQIKRKNESLREFVLTEQDLELSGGKRQDSGGWRFVSKNGKVNHAWLKYFKQKWLRRTRGWALKFVFPDIIKFDIEEYTKPIIDIKNIEKALNPIEKMKEISV